MREGWKTTTIGDECELLNGYAFKSSDYVPHGGILNFRVTNINWDGTVDIEKDVEYLPADFAKEYDKYLLNENDILFVMVGATRGKFAIIPKHILPALMNQNMWRIVPKNKQIDKYFLYCYLRSKLSILFEQNEDQARGFFKKSDFNALPLCLPPLPEQRRIAYVLSTVQKAIEQQDKLIRATTELKKTLMQKLFTEGTKGEKQKMTEIGPVPESWEVVELSQVCEKPQYGFTDSAAPTGNAKFLRITDITEFGVNWNDVPFCNCHDLIRYELRDRDIVFARIGATTGKSYLIKNPPKSVYASYLIRVRCKQEMLPEFLIYYFASEQYWQQIDATKGNNLKGGVNGSILSKLKTSKPSIEEQKSIADTFKALDKKLSYYLKKKNTLTSLFRTLLHELMTGARRVHEIEFEKMPEAANA